MTRYQALFAERKAAKQGLLRHTGSLIHRVLTSGRGGLAVCMCEGGRGKKEMSPLGKS